MVIDVCCPSLSTAATCKSQKATAWVRAELKPALSCTHSSGFRKPRPKPSRAVTSPAGLASGVSNEIRPSDCTPTKQKHRSGSLIQGEVATAEAMQNKSIYFYMLVYGDLVSPYCSDSEFMCTINIIETAPPKETLQTPATNERNS
jgi:hypothetical protein